jgi:hypothetical protein
MTATPGASTSSTPSPRSATSAGTRSCSPG